METSASETQGSSKTQVTPQMHTLGRTADDDKSQDQRTARWNNRCTTNNNEESPSPRRSPKPVKKKAPHIITDGLYAPMRDEPARLQPRRPWRRLLRRAPPQRSHIILRDGHFYVRDLNSNENPSSLGTLAQRVTSPDASCDYREAPSTVLTPALRRYRERFEELNKDSRQLQMDRMGEYDLFLTVEGEPEEQPAEPQTLRTVETSSLFYEVEEGGITMMCLPRDRVRLVMDPELETGTLAVEQWRRVEDEDDDAGDSGGIPNLRYVLVVNDDLYRNMVSELSSHMTEPYCGANRCCLEDEKVDIRIAIVVLVVVLIMMFATTIMWPTQ